MRDAPAVSWISELRSEEELTRCVELLRAAFGTVARDFGLTEESAPTNAAFATLENLQRHIEKGLMLFGMICGTSLDGCVGIRKSKNDDSVFSIERLAVAPDKRHRGYGGQLLSFALDRVRAQGGRTASIGVMDNNEVLKSWYVSKGFAQHDCRRVQHLPFKVCFMSLDLGRGDRP